MLICFRVKWGFRRRFILFETEYVTRKSFFAFGGDGWEENSLRRKGGEWKGGEWNGTLPPPVGGRRKEGRDSWRGISGVISG